MRIHRNLNKDNNKLTSHLPFQNLSGKNGSINSRNDQLLSLNGLIGNQSMLRLMDNSNSLNSNEKTIQRKDLQGESNSEQNQKKGCECDCEHYSPRVARYYINKHIRYQEYYDKWGSATPKKIKLKLLSTECHYQDNQPPSCSWVSVLDYEDVNAAGRDKKKYRIYVLLMSSQRFNVVAYDPKYPLCSYDFECDSSGNFTKIILKEVGCIDRDPIFRELD